MKLNNFLNDKRTWAPADGAAPGGVEDGAPADTAPADAAPADPTANQEPTPTDYSYLPETVRGDDGLNAEAFKTHYEELAAENARFKDGLAAVPEDGKYEFALPEDLKFGELDLPEGFQVDLKADDEAFTPLFTELGGWLKKYNVPGEAGKEITGLLAQYEATKASGFHTAAKAEFEKLGADDTARNARIGATKRAIEAKLPAEQAKALMAAANTFEGVRALETLFLPRGPGATPPSNPSKQETDEQRLQARYNKSKG